MQALLFSVLVAGLLSVCSIVFADDKRVSSDLPIGWSTSSLNGADPVVRIPSPSEEGIALTELPTMARDHLTLLRPGLTRSQIEKYFEMDGGINGFSSQRYSLRDVIVKSKVVMVEIAFQPAKMPNDIYADLQQAARWRREHRDAYFKPDDVVRGVSQPFLSLRTIN